MLTFLFRSVLNWIVDLLVYPLAPIAVMCQEKDGRLPKWARWMEVFDALGPNGHKAEPACAHWVDRYGAFLAYVFWLYRNKAYTLRLSWRADINYQDPLLCIAYSGSVKPPKVGPWYFHLRVNDYWESRYGFSFGAFTLYIKTGWKLKGLITGWRPTDEELKKSPVGLFTGIAPRSEGL